MTPAAALVATASLAAVLIGAAPAPVAQEGAGTVQPQGDRVEIPGAPDCFIYVAAWKNGSWFDPDVKPEKRTAHSGAIDDSSRAKSDVRDVTRWLGQVMAQSPDMVAKMTKACQASGRNFLQIGIVRDDPDTGPGAWYPGTPIVLMDYGDIEKLGKHAESPGTANPSKENRARLQVAALVPIGLLAHEGDHAQRAGEHSEFWTPIMIARERKDRPPREIADENTRIAEFTEKFENLAVEDENTVINELDDFKRSGYSRTAYDDGMGGIPYVIDGVQVRLNAAAALGRVEHAGHEHRYGDLDGSDVSTLEKTPNVVNRATETTSLPPKSADPAGSQYVFNRTSRTDELYLRHLAGRISDSVHQDLASKDLASRQLIRQTRQIADSVAPANSPPDAGDVNVAKVNSASGSERNQDVGGTVLYYITNSAVMSDRRSPRRLPWSGGENPSFRASLVRSTPDGRPTPGSRTFRGGASQTTSGAASTLQAIFVATGRSSGAAFQMTVAHDGPHPLELVDPGFVLEPVQGVSAAEAERELAKVKGRRKTITIDGYCLEMRKPPPAAGMVYRLAKNPVQQRHPQLAPIMIATKALKEAGQLHPDTDPVQYFHSIRQWALWTYEQKFRDEAAFADAFVDHSRKNLESAGRPWTRELEQNVRRLMPNRWRDISEVMKLAGLVGTESK